MQEDIEFEDLQWLVVIFKYEINPYDNGPTSPNSSHKYKVNLYSLIFFLNILHFSIWTDVNNETHVI